MKYILLISGRIVDVSSFDEYQTNNEKGESVFDGFGNGKVYFPAEDILKQSDRIEKLCDSYVLCDVAGGQPIVGDLANDKHRFELVTASLHDLYLAKRITKKDYWLKLAIWTDKGLIYVAEMNEKGKWELL